MIRTYRDLAARIIQGKDFNLDERIALDYLCSKVEPGNAVDRVRFYLKQWMGESKFFNSQTTCDTHETSRGADITIHIKGHTFAIIAETNGTEDSLAGFHTAPDGKGNDLTMGRFNRITFSQIMMDIVAILVKVNKD